MKKLYWLDVLNNQAEWLDDTEKWQWLVSIFGRKAKLADRSLRHFDEALQYMRSITDSLHFGEELKLDWLDKRLAKVRPSAVLEKFLPGPVLTVMPLFHASTFGQTDDDILDAITNTLLLQFGQFIGGATQDKQTPQICRCQGIVRTSENDERIELPAKLTKNELRWRQELELFNEYRLIESPDVERCADLFIATPKARFCSDACRFATFQFAKHLKSPDYHAEKQKRYRDRLADSPERSKSKRSQSIKNKR